MIQLTKLKKLENNFPVLTGDKALSKKLCDQLIKEIQDMNSFDDTIMGGRSRINKGSKNFNKYLKKSNVSQKIFRHFNSKIFYKKIEKIFSQKFKKSSCTRENLNRRVPNLVSSSRGPLDTYYTEDECPHLECNIVEGRYPSIDRTSTRIQEGWECGSKFPHMRTDSSIPIDTTRQVLNGFRCQSITTPAVVSLKSL